MGDGLDMDVDATSYQMNVLVALGDELNQACGSGRRQIDWLSGTLGQGPMGARFTAAYQPGRTSLEQQIDGAQQRTTGLGAAGAEAVRDYATADAQAEAELLRVRFQ